MELDQLLSLIPKPLSNEQFERLLEHDKWKLEKQHEHEIKLEEIRTSKRNSGNKINTPSPPNLEEDRKFNEITSYGFATDRHLGVIAKTKIYEGAVDRATSIYPRWLEHIQDNNIIILKDIKDGRIKTLLQHFLWANGCAHRITKWPDAKDSHLIDTLKKDLNSKFSKFSKQTIIAAYESLKVFWKEINDYEQVPFNVSIIGHILDEAYEYTNSKVKVDYKNDIKNSPFFREFEKIHPQVPLSTLEKYYIKSRQNFKTAGISSLRRVFTEAPPPDLEDKYSAKEWMRVWHQHISAYQPRWQKQLDELISTYRSEQEKWKTE